MAENSDVMPDRPSRHGKLLGEALATIAEAGRPEGTPDLCATCAFRCGSVPNMSAGTVKQALDILLGLDSDDFACHHGMKDGRPTKLCIGALYAKQAPFEKVRQRFKAALGKFDSMSGDDEVRLEFDRWWFGVDPDKKMNVYELASAFARRERSALPPTGECVRTDDDARGP